MTNRKTDKHRDQPTDTEFTLQDISALHRSKQRQSCIQVNKSCSLSQEQPLRGVLQSSYSSYERGCFSRAAGYWTATKSKFPHW